MHYTSIENIHKVIDPLFLDDLKKELADIKAIKTTKTKRQKLLAFQNKLASLKFLDPACGSGNFLTESYLSLRRLENDILQELSGLEITFGFEGEHNPIKVSIHQFYGIEINDFAVAVTKAALWIAESQALQETENIVHLNLDFLPLKSYANIYEGNALRVAWREILPPGECNFIMGNPPFVGHQWRSTEQISDMEIAFHDLPKHGKLDYVCAWYNKGIDYMQGTNIFAAFVSTNSIVQGESVGILWQFLFDKKLVIEFAHRPFVWTSESNEQAAVHCVIVGFSQGNNSRQKLLFSGNQAKIAENINGYLLDAPNVFIQARSSSMANDVPKICKGSQPTDNQNLLLSQEEYDELVSSYPKAKNLIKRFVGASEFINNQPRYCLWLNNIEPVEYSVIPVIMNRLKKVADFRKKSPTESVRRDADIPMLFTQIRQPNESYLLIPRHSSQSRKYIPIGYMSHDVICGDANYMIPCATLYLFGVLTSNVHMAWTTTLCGRIKSDYRYSPAIYNNFPWPQVTTRQKEEIEDTAQAIIDARAKYPNSSLAILYGRNSMPPELTKAHQANVRAVMAAYGFDVKSMTEAECVARLMEMYVELTK
ncbi:MAG: class I SAM-dependent DNA methyltransferase [Selenomonadaceae bacterium]|nr:class I SAM-dependent DNA methyltransferase [Selenomonadaceae bacterium]